MDESAIDHLLANLSADHSGWSGVVPVEAGTFLGHPIELAIQTRGLDMSIFDGVEQSPPPPADERILSLARQILADLPQVLAIAEREYEDYEEDRFDPSLVSDPNIWLSCEFEEDGPERWAFVVGRTDWPDYGVHIEFDGLDFHDCWASD